MFEKIELEPIVVEPEIYNYRKWIEETDAKVLLDEFSRFLKEVGYTVLNHVEHYFPNAGYTCLWLLAESHLAIHTFPERSMSYIELSGCNKAKNDAFMEIVDRKYKNVKQV